MNGGQLQELFRAYNIVTDSKVVNMNLSYNVGDYYNTAINNGSQVQDAFKAINAYESEELLDTSITFNASNGGRLLAEMDILQTYIAEEEDSLKRAK